MPKKRKKLQKQRTSSLKKQPILSLDEQEQRAYALFADKSYKDAISVCKQLIKQEKRPEWVELLSAVYDARSRELADKKMYKEALVIWHNRVALCDEPLIDAFYVQLLLTVNEVSPVIELYRQHCQILDQIGLLKSVSEYLAARSLVKSASVLKTLPCDDMIVKDHIAADSALMAYCAGDDDLLNEQLKTIPYRSPYRDLKLILKAMSLLEMDAERAVKLLERVPENSFFLPLATAVLAVQEPEFTLFSRMVKLKPEVIQLMTALRGYDVKLLKFINELKLLGSSPSAASLMRFIIKQKKLLGRQNACDCAYVVLTQSLNLIPQFIKAFGMPSEADCDRSEALEMEIMKEHPLDIAESWERTEFSLKPENCASENDYHLTLAMIGRRKLMHIDRESDPDISTSDCLEKILLHDPMDRENYIRIISDYRHRGDLSKARAWLDQAMEHFPEDMLVLSEAVETALMSKAYKKAATLAKRVLEKDPINQRVRTSLIDAYLSHARKLLAKNKFSLVEKELCSAENWARTKKDKARVGFLRGVSYYTQKKIDEASTCWQTAVEIHGGLCGYFHLLLELLEQKLPATKVLKQAKITLSVKTLNKADFLTFFKMLGQRNKKQQTSVLFVALSKMFSTMKKGIKQPFNEIEFEMICETLQMLNQDALLSHYACQANKQYTEKLVFDYYKIAARAMEKTYLTDADGKALEKIVHTAQEAGDKKLAMRIVKLLQEFSSPLGILEERSDNSLEDEMLAVEDLIDVMLKELPQNEIDDIRQELGEAGLREFLADMIEHQMNNTLDDVELDPSKPVQKRSKSKKIKNIRKDDGMHDQDSQLELF